MSNQGRIEEIKNTGQKEAVTAPAQELTQAEKPKGRTPMHRPGVVLFVAALVIGGVIFGAMVLLGMLTHESTDDAFIDGHVILIAPKISGKVAKVNVVDNQEVKKGDTLLEIDSRDYDSVVAQKQAALDVTKAKEKSAEASVQQTAANIETLRAGMESLYASQQASKTAADLAHSDLTREQSLVDTKVVSAQDFEHSKSAADTADANLLSKVKEVAAATAYIGYARAQKASADAQVVAALADVTQAQAELDAAKLQQGYTTIIAPEDGHVTSKAVDAGDYVQVGQTLMALVPHEVWVTANFKETQITFMRPGQPVEIAVDAYPDRKLKGHVDSIQAGSGARFSLLPPENATGNFVKVVQRVPVKIVFDEQEDVQRVLGPGMSAVPEVQVKNMAGPAFLMTCIAGVAIFAVVVLTMIWLGKIRREH